MSDVEITITGAEDVIRRLGDIQSGRVLRPAMQGSLEVLRGDLARYPRPPAHTWGKWQFVSDKQRRWFFWALRNGQITVPYRRTGSLGRLWTTKITGVGMHMYGHVGNALGQSYGRYVQDKPRQALIHQGRWSTVQDVAKKRIGAIKRLFEQAIAGAWR